MIHLPCSRIEVGSEVDWEGCKQVYQVLKDAEARKKEEEDKSKRPVDESKMSTEDPLGNVVGPTSDQKDSPQEPGSKPSGPITRRKKSASANLSSDGSSSSAYSGPVTRQRQRQNQGSAEAGTWDLAAFPPLRLNFSSNLWVILHRARSWVVSMHFNEKFTSHHIKP